jgi:hypothetical protein
MGILALRGIIRGKSLLAGGKSIFVLMKKEREREHWDIYNLFIHSTDIYLTKNYTRK